MGPRRPWQTQLLLDSAHDDLRCVQDFVIREAQDTEAHGFEPCRALLVTLALLVVDAAVDLDAQLRLRAAEVDDEPRHRVLAAEVEARTPLLPQKLPHRLLRRGHGGAQLPRPPDDLRRGVSHPASSAHNSSDPLRRLTPRFTDPTSAGSRNSSQAPPPPRSPPSPGTGEGLRS